MCLRLCPKSLLTGMRLRPGESSGTRTTVPKRPCGKPLLACRQEVTDSRTEQPSHRQFSSEVAPRAYFRALPWTWVPTGDDALVALGWLHQRLIQGAKSGSRGTRADQGVRPTNSAARSRRGL